MPPDSPRARLWRSIRESDLPGPARALLMHLAWVANPETGQIADYLQPSATDLAKMLGFSPKTVRRSLSELDRCGWISRDASGPAAKARGITVQYTLGARLIHNHGQSDQAHGQSDQAHGQSDHGLPLSSSKYLNARARARERGPAPYDIPAQEAIYRATHPEGD